MTVFSSDVDLLKFEPVVFRDLWLASQTLVQGSDGVLSGTTLTSAGASFTSLAVKAGQVICLSTSDLSVDGCFEIVSVDSATQLTVSVLRADVEDVAVAPPNGSGIRYRISTFEPQAAEAAESLLRYFWIGDEAGETTLDEVLNTEALRQASVFAVLTAIFAASAAGADSEAGYYAKSLHYQQRFNTARMKVRLALDRDGDGVADSFLRGGSVRLRRS